jgi:hypothetical protein
MATPHFYPDYLTTHKSLIESALGKFGQDVVVIVDPLECDGTKIEPGAKDIIVQWNEHLSQLAKVHVKTMFFSAHHSLAFVSSDQDKAEILPGEPGTCAEYYYTTFFGMVPTYPPLLQACQKIAALQGTTHFDAMIQQIPQYCLPNLRNIGHFLNHYSSAAGKKEFKTLESVELDETIIDRHGVRMYKTLATATTYNSTAQRRFLASSLTHSYNPFSHETSHHLSPLLERIGYMID